jgi:hypothetical protein
MRRLRELNRYRDRGWERGLGMLGDDHGGCFVLRSETTGVTLRCMIGVGEGWDHISVSTNLPRCPSWAEMEQVKRTFFRPEEEAMQIHAPVDDHISVHPHCLHIWRPHSVHPHCLHIWRPHSGLPLPPKWMV